MPSSRKYKKKIQKVKITLIMGYFLIFVVMTFAIVTLYIKLEEYSSKSINTEDFSELLTIGNTLSMLYEIESEQNLINVENAVKYFQKYDSIVPKIKENLTELKEVANDSSRIIELDTIQILVDTKRKNLQDVAVLLDSFSRAPRMRIEYQNSYVPPRLNREIVDFLERKNPTPIDIHKSDTSVVVGSKRGFLDRVRDVFVGRLDSTLVIENKSVVTAESELKLIVDTIVNKVRYSERLDLERERVIHLAYLKRQETMIETNRMLTSHINALLKAIEREELEESLLLIHEKEETLSDSQKTIFLSLSLALLISMIFAVLLLVDINKSVRFKRQLELSNKRISDLLNSREKLMLAISHDIKAPMSSILGFIELMDTQGNQKNELYLRNMKNSGEHILDLASALIDFHRLEDGSWKLKESNFNLHDLLENTTAGFLPLAIKKGLQYIVKNEVPAQFITYCDQYVIRRIMSNIISNAIKYTSEGSVMVMIWLDTSEIQKRLVFSIADTGTGIDEAEQKVIFHKYKQLNNSIGTEGSGLGLLITKGFINLLKGQIHLNSRKGEGSEFIVQIPLKKAKEVQVRNSDKNELSEISQDHEFKGVSVLLVDDDPIQLTMTSEMLARKNIDCVMESDPDKVIPLLQSSSFDILFLDIQMPETSGLALVEKLRRLKNKRVNQLPIIGLSAKLDISSEEMKEAGFTDFLAKPFTSDDLFGIVQKYIGGEILEKKAENLFEKSPVQEKGAAALISFVKDDKKAALAILQSFIDETGKSRYQLEEAFQNNEEKKLGDISHKLLPLFRIMDNNSMTILLEKLERGDAISDEEMRLVLSMIDHHLHGANILSKDISGA